MGLEFTEGSSLMGQKKGKGKSRDGKKERSDKSNRGLKKRGDRCPTLAFVETPLTELTAKTNPVLSHWTKKEENSTYPIYLQVQTNY